MTSFNSRNNSTWHIIILFWRVNWGSEMLKSFPGISELVSGRAEIQRQCFPCVPLGIKTLKLSFLWHITGTANFQRTSTALGWWFGAPGNPREAYITLGVLRRLKQSLGFIHTAVNRHRQCLIWEQEKASYDRCRRKELSNRNRLALGQHFFYLCHSALLTEDGRTKALSPNEEKKGRKFKSFLHCLLRTKKLKVQIAGRVSPETRGESHCFQAYAKAPRAQSYMALFC